MSLQWALTSHSRSWVFLLFQGTHSKGGTVRDSLGSPTVGAYMFVCVTVIKSQAIIHGLNQKYLSVDGRGLALQTLRGKFKSLSVSLKGKEQVFGKKGKKILRKNPFPGWGGKSQKKNPKTQFSTFGSYFIYLELKKILYILQSV